MFFSCLSYFWGNDGVIGAAEFLIYILYIRKHSREKTFTNFTVLWLFAVNIGAWHPLKSFLHENCIFHQFANVFSLESFPLYSVQLSNLVVCSLDSLVPRPPRFFVLPFLVQYNTRKWFALFCFRVLY